MSQSPNSTDTQVMLQSMLQRLKIQQGKDSVTQQHTHGPISTVSTCAEGVTEASSVQKLNNGPVGGHEFGSNGIPPRVLKITEADQSLDLKGEVAQKRVLNWEVDKGHISFPVQKDQSDGGTSQNRVMGQDMQLRVPPADTEQLLPAKLPKDVTFNGAHVQTVNIGSVTVSSTEQQTRNQGFQPKVFAWSSSPTHGAGTPRYRVLPLENGEFLPSTDTHMTATNLDKERGGFSRTQQSTGNKTRRWTQRIKARWKDRPGSFGKKQKEEQTDAKQMGQQAELLGTNNVISASNREEETVVPQPDPSDPCKTALTRMEDTNNEACTSSDFEFSLGSFSLLEEISSGQEWANFLTPNLTSASADLRPLQKVRTPTFSTWSRIPNHSSDNQRGFYDRGAPPFSDISVAQPVNMDISEEQQGARRASEHTERMEHGHAPSDVRVQRQTRPLSLSQCADIQNNPWMKSRIQMNRKRHHHLTERTEVDLQMDVKHPDREVVTSSWSSSEMGMTGTPNHDGGPPSFSPSLPRPPKGVLKHSISQDSQSSVEFLTKRRRVEEKRHVRFLEQVVTIMPPELDPDLSDPEEDFREEEDSFIQQELEHEEEQSGMEEVAPARRPALPAWILSLKKLNPQRKHQK